MSPQARDRSLPPEGDVAQRPGRAGSAGGNLVAGRGLILFAHGARDPRWAAPFEAVAAQLRQAVPGTPVQLAFLELMVPSLPDAATALTADGCADIHVLPLFLGNGGHLRRDLPLLMDQLRAAHPAVRFTLHAAVGEAPGVIAAMAAVAVAALEPPA